MENNLVLLDFPEMVKTYDYDGGAKAIQAVLTYYNIDEREDRIMKLAGTTEIGTPILGIKKTANKHKLRCKIMEMKIKDIKEFIDRMVPVILLVQKGRKKTWKNGYYTVAIGYDSERIYFEDPSSVKRTYLTFSELKERWHDEDTDGKRYFHPGIIVLGNKLKRTKKYIKMG